MKRQQGRCRILGAGGSLLLLFLWACGGGAESGSHDVLLSIHGERLSATLRQASVSDVFAELAWQTGIQVHVEGAAAIETVSAEFTNLPLEEGIKRILQGKNYALTYADEEPGRLGVPKIVAIRVLATRTEPIPSGPPSEVATGAKPRLDISEVIRESKIGDRSSLASLLSATHDADPRVRRTAVKSLADLGDESAVDALGQLLISDSDKKVRRAATDALAEIGSPQALRELGRALKDQDLVVQRNAAEAIVAIGGEQTLTRLREAARDQ
jgi:HEAT repeat protein